MIDNSLGVPSASTAYRSVPAAPEVYLGVTLACRVCGVHAVVRHAGTPIDHLTCHVPLEVARPVACAATSPGALDDGMLAGSVFTDPVTGLTLRCTRGGPGQIMVDGRALVRVA